MPRYIKEYDVYERLRIEAHYTHAECEKILEGIPKADVVPRSEYEDLELKLEAERSFKPLAITLAKQEVAREMSAEMGHEIAEALKSNYKALSEFEEADELYYRVKGKIDALRGIQDFLAELEKKYIGEVTENE